MRPKFILVLVLLTLLILGAGFLLTHRPGNPPASVPTPPETAIAPTDSGSAAPAVPPPAPVAAAPAASTPTPEQRQAAVEAEIDRLQLWSGNEDQASLSNILADLNNPDKEIRDAAIEATKQFGSTNAIPALKAAVNNTEDTQEKIAMLEAVDFLSLPNISTIQLPPPTPEQLQAANQRAIEIQKRHDKNQNPGSGTPPASGQNPPAGTGQ